MRRYLTSVTVLAAVAIVGVGSAVASACEWNQNHTAAAAPKPPTEYLVVAPATTVDPLLLAKLEKTALLPTAPVEKAVDAGSVE